jgi:short-subunit dehydrogenase
VSDPIALITGGSSGIGAAFARALAARGYRLILVGRSAQRLSRTAAALPGAVIETLDADLSTDTGCAQIEERLTNPGRPVDLLVNSAGQSSGTSFAVSAAAHESALLRLNVEAVLRLTRAVLPGMMSRGRGDIVNISSMACFGTLMPGSTYPASKAWVTSFTRSVAQSVAPYGVRMLAVCPGYVRTEFHQRSGIDMSATPQRLWLDADTVARTALRDLGRGRTVCVPGWKYKVAAFAAHHLPGTLMQRVAGDRRGLLALSDLAR